MDTVAFVKAIALTSSGLFAGYTWALSHAGIPSILGAPEAVVARQWREQYLAGFYISRPLCAINAAGWFYLAYHAPPNSLARTLYIVASLTNASGVPFALTILRATNGALSRRSERLAGPHAGGPVIALTYASHEKRSVELDERCGTEVLVKQWAWLNWIRTGVLVFGVIVGGLGISA